MLAGSKLLLRGQSRALSSWAGKTVVVSGASSGIGEELCLQYAKLGANIVLSARREDRLLNASSKCKSNGAPLTEVIRCDVSKKEDCDALIAKTISKFGKIDMLVLNAGVGQTFFLEAMKPDVNYHQFMDINYYGCVYPTIAALPHLQVSNGRIVVVSSLGGLIPFPRQTFYNASKYALNGFFESLRMELMAKDSGVSITMICPGFVKTEITAGGGLGRDGKPIGDTGKKMPVSMITAEECVRDIMAAADKRQSRVITPKWYTPIFILRQLFPKTVDKMLNKLFSPKPKK